MVKSRGANSTSVDAFMVAETRAGRRACLARISHQLPAADADLLAVTRRTPSSRFYVVRLRLQQRVALFRSVRLVTAASPRPRDESW